MDRDRLRKNSSWANLAYLGRASELSATLTSVWISSMRASVSLFLWWHFGAFVVKMGRKGRNKSRVERVVRWKEARAGWRKVDQVSFCPARSPGEATRRKGGRTNL